VSFNDLNPSWSLDVKLKHLFTALMIAVLVYGAVRCLTVRQLYHQNTQSLSTFVCACNDGVLPVTLSPIAEAQASILVPRIMPVSVVRCYAHYV
jgi:hypothetical protein